MGFLRLAAILWMLNMVASSGAGALPSVILSMFAMAELWLLLVAGRQRGQAKQDQENQADAIRRLRAVSPILIKGPPIGTFQGQEIPAWFRDGDGQTHHFVSIWNSKNPPDLSPGDSFIWPGLLYTTTTPAPTDESTR